MLSRAGAMRMPARLSGVDEVGRSGVNDERMVHE
jgi:hypothetical protein